VLRKDRIQFIAEQDGLPESDLKDALNKVFDVHQSVDKAYLALVGYDEAARSGSPSASHPPLPTTRL
jgi:hypothetical protein